MISGLGILYVQSVLDLTDAQKELERCINVLILWHSQGQFQLIEGQH